jgi:hypothetical protein
MAVVAGTEAERTTLHAFENPETVVVVTVLTVTESEVREPIDIITVVTGILDGHLKNVNDWLKDCLAPR